MKSKSHLTESGLKQILDIRSGMNMGRKHRILNTNTSLFSLLHFPHLLMMHQEVGGDKEANFVNMKCGITISK
jgi:hypothetical protein